MPPSEKRIETHFKTRLRRLDPALVLQLSAIRYRRQGILFEATDELAGRGLPSRGKTAHAFRHDP